MPGPDPNNIATIYANNMKFTAWGSVMVQRVFGEGYSTFQFSASEGYYGNKMLGLQIAPGDPVTVSLAGQIVLTGYCATRAGAYDAKSHQVVIAGTSRTVDLATSSVRVQPGTYDGSTFQQATQAVIAPHGISLSMANPPDGASQPFKTLVPQYGEKVAAFINRIAGARNLFITDDVNGNLVAGQADANATISGTLVEGQNILRCSFKLNDSSMNSSSKLQGVSQTTGDDNNYPPRAYSATATYSAPRSNTYSLYVSEHPDDNQGLVSGVTHQAMYSLWPEIEVEVTVPGWLRPSDGKLWAPSPDSSGIVSVFSPLVFPNQTGMAILAIQAVRFEQSSENGTTTTLTLRRQSALTHAKTAGVGDSAPTPSVSADSPDWQTADAAGGAQ